MRLDISALSVLAIVSFCSFSYAANSVDGNWIVAERICNSGKPANDAFILGRDSISLRIGGGNVYTETLINGKSKRVFGYIDYDKNQILISPVLNPFELDANDKLNIFTAGFGPGGSCAEGETLKTSFKRV